MNHPADLLSSGGPRVVLRGALAAAATVASCGAVAAAAAALLGAQPWVVAAAGIAAASFAGGIAAATIALRARSGVPVHAVPAIPRQPARLESDAAALLECLDRLSTVSNRKSWADVVSSVIATLTGMSGGAVVLRAPGSDSMSLVGASVPIVISKLDATVREPHGPSRRAQSSGTPVTMGAGELPAWAAAAGFEAGAVFPVLFHGASIGLAYAFGKPWETPSATALIAASRFLTVAAAHYAVSAPLALPVMSSPSPARSPAPVSPAVPRRQMESAVPAVAGPSSVTAGPQIAAPVARTTPSAVPAPAQAPADPVALGAMMRFAPGAMSPVASSSLLTVAQERVSMPAPTLTEAHPEPSLQSADRKRLELPGVVVDPRTDRCVIDGRAVTLSRTEFDLLYVLASNGGEVVPTDRLLRAVWGDSSSAPSSALDVTIHRVRKKLGRTPGGADLIRTVRGKGYAILIPDPAAAPGRQSHSRAVAG